MSEQAMIFFVKMETTITFNTHKPPNIIGCTSPVTLKERHFGKCTLMKKFFSGDFNAS